MVATLWSRNAAGTMPKAQIDEPLGERLLQTLGGANSALTSGQPLTKQQARRADSAALAYIQSACLEVCAVRQLAFRVSG